MECQKNEDDALSQMITPIATNLCSGKTKNNVRKDAFKSLLSGEKPQECEMISVTHQYGISAEEYEELIYHHCISFSMISKVEEVQESELISR